MKTYYKLIPLCDKPRLLDTHEEAMAATKAMRKQNLGYFLYEATKQDNRERLTFIGGWNPRV